MFIENTTPYIGKTRIRLQRHPVYSGGDPWSKLNKVHLNLGFTKLVSRIYPNQTKEGLELNKAKIRDIETFTNGKIGNYEWWHCKSKKTGKCKTLTKLPNPDIYETLYHNKLHNSFLSNDGIFVGNVEDGWWYYRNQFRISDKYPSKVAIQYEKEAYDRQYLYYLSGGTIPTDKIIGCYGYSHRGGTLFKIGDRIFDETYEPIEDDYEPWEWAGWVLEYETELNDAKKRKDDFDIRDIESDGVSRYIPFVKRGNKIITNWDDAQLAAYNLANYLS